jgi:hypothetical protein
VIEPKAAELWFCGKQIHPGKALKDFIGNNEKTKVIVKIQKKGQGAPAREPAISEAEKKELMMYAYRKQEEAKVRENRFLFSSQLVALGFICCLNFFIITQKHCFHFNLNCV